LHIVRTLGDEIFYDDASFEMKVSTFFYLMYV